jgi:hypothetical protein
MRKMMKLTKNKMIHALVEELDYWEFDDIMHYIKQLEQRRLLALTEEEIEFEYVSVFGDDE